MNSFSFNSLLLLADKNLIDNNLYFNEIFFDSRNIINPEKGIFFCFEKNKQKAEKYIKEAYYKKILFFVSYYDFNLENAFILSYKNPVFLLQKFAENHLLKLNLKTIGITGSNGKTILKEWIFSSLKNDFKIVRSPKSYNSQIGLPISILQSSENHNLGIFECGISKVNEMQKLQDILNPEIGILTNIGNAHLENFDSIEELIKEKIKLFKNSKTIFYCNDNQKLDYIINKTYKNKEFITFGQQNDSDVKYISTENNILIIKFNNKIYEFKVNFSDSASINNQLALISVLFYFGFDNHKIQEKLLELETIEMRLEIKNGIYNSILINDSFNADYESIKIALQTLNNQNKNKKIVIISDIFQLEKDKKTTYKNLFKLLNNYTFNDIFCLGKDIKNYINLSENKIKYFNSYNELLNYFNEDEIKDSAILIKGSRKFQLENITKHLEFQSHDTILEVNLTSIIKNIHVFKEFLKPETKIMAMVKANSYGIGNFEIAQILQHYNIDYLGVAYADEGKILRNNGIHIPIMVMNPEQNSYFTLIDYFLEPEIYSKRVFNLFCKELNKKSISKPYPIHLKINTGMNRLGFNINEYTEIIKLCKENPQVYVKSIFTHLTSTDENDINFTNFQINKFNQTYDLISKGLNYKPIKHALNSHGIINFPDYQFDMVRVGIGMYGFSADEKTQNKLQNVVTLKTKISQILDIQKNESVGYNRKFISDENIKIATLPIGYADGIFRKLGNGNFSVLINNQKAKTIGNICMDMMMVNIKNIKCKEGDEVIIYNENNSIPEIAESIQTISYELLTSISSRVKRIYYKE